MYQETHFLLRAQYRRCNCGVDQLFQPTPPGSIRDGGDEYVYFRQEFCDVSEISLPRQNGSPKPETRTTAYTLYLLLAFPRYFAIVVAIGEAIEFKRRIGPDPRANGAKAAACGLPGCLQELENGDIAVIGIDITDAAIHLLPPTAGCGPDERVVRLPRNLLVNARRDIPDKA